MGFDAANSNTEGTSERRKRRSEDPLVALHFQLSTALRESEAAAVVLADMSGVVVAGAGSWALCEELAAYAPLIARNDVAAEGGRIQELRGHVEVRTLVVEGQEVLLCARGVPAFGTALVRAAEGVKRILKRAA
ncbi:MAG: hypothetical protein U0169_14290 [Polyangiaceae bacterium]